jgi:N-acetylmuramoyl-L-alanine amidase
MKITLISRIHPSVATSQNCSSAVVMLLVVVLCSSVAFAQKPLTGLTVCIDPGHGGQGSSASYTGGFVGPRLGLTESRACLKIGTLLAERFREAGASVKMTRTKDRRVTREGTTAEQEIQARVDIASRAKANIMLSIHLSSYPRDPKKNQTNIYYNPPYEALETTLGQVMGKQLSAMLGTEFSQPTKRPVRIIRNAPMPALMLEVSSISNHGEERRLAKLSHSRLVADALFRGFMIYYEKHGSRLLEAGPAPGSSSRQGQQVTRQTQPTPAPGATPRRDTRPSIRTAPTPIAKSPRTTPTPLPTNQIELEVGGDFKFIPQQPILLNPMEGLIDQAWLYGESYNDLPLQRGICFDVPEDTPVVAVAAGVVEKVIPTAERGPVDMNKLTANTRELLPGLGQVILRHDDPKLNGESIWTVYSRLTEVYLSPGETVAAGEVLGKTGKPYDGSPASRYTAFQLQVRLGANSPHKTINPSPLIRHVKAAGRGMVALKITDKNGLLLPTSTAVEGFTKGDQFPRFGYSLTYQRGVNPNPKWGENLFVCDLPAGNHRFIVHGEEKIIPVKANGITHATWQLKHTVP